MNKETTHPDVVPESSGKTNCTSSTPCGDRVHRGGSYVFRGQKVCKHQYWELDEKAFLEPDQNQIKYYSQEVLDEPVTYLEKRLTSKLKASEEINEKRAETIREQNARIWDLESEVNALKAQIKNEQWKKMVRVELPPVPNQKQIIASENSNPFAVFEKPEWEPVGGWK